MKRFLLHRFLRRSHSLLPDTRGHPILDVGMGEGLFWVGGPSSEVVGVDVRLEALTKAANTGMVPIAGLADRLPFRTNSFDYFVAIEILEHLLDPEPALAEISRVTRSGGLISVPWEPWFSLMVLLGTGSHLRRLGREPEHVQAFGPRQLTALLERHFDTVSLHPTLPWLLAEVRKS